MDQSEDEWDGFPNVGDDVDGECVPETAAEFEYEYALAMAVLPGHAEPTAGTELSLPPASSTDLVSLPVQDSLVEEPCSSAGLMSPTATLAASSAMVATPPRKDQKRRRILTKQAAWEVDTPEKTAKPQPEVFLEHPCMKHFKMLSQSQQSCARKRFRLKKHRAVQSLKKGTEMVMQGVTYVWPKDPLKEELFLKEFNMAYLYHLAASPTTLPEERGLAMDNIVQLRGTEALQEQSKALEARVVKSKSILMTYNGPWGILQGLSLPPTSSLQEVTDCVRVDPGAKELFADVMDFHVQLRLAKKITEFVISLEICTGTWKEKGSVRVHVHTWVLKQCGGLKLEDLQWRDTSPYLNTQAQEYFGGRGSRSASAAYAGAFYLQIEKYGTVWSDGSVQPFRNYAVKDYWITSLLAGEKVNFNVARRMYLRCVTRAENNIRQLEYVERAQSEMDAAAEREANEAQILKTQAEFITIPEVEAWKEQYQQAKSRYKFLVLDGKSQTGKTRFAYSLSPPPTTAGSSPPPIPGQQPPSRLPSKVYYCDCSGGLPDLRKFNRRLHKVIVLDEISPKQAIVLKKILQCSNDDALMGASPTMQHAYVVNTYRTMIVITTNTWQAGIGKMPGADYEWLQANSVVINVQQPLWKQA